MKFQSSPSLENSAHLGKPAFSTEQDGTISVFETHTQAEEAVKLMQHAGFDMKKISIVGRNYESEEHIVGYYNMGDRTKFWGKLGAFWGGLYGLLFGSAFFLVPGVGPLVIAGSFIATLAATLEGAVVVGGLSALGAALFSLGIRKDSVIKYEADLKAGRYLMIAHGTKKDLAHAREIAKSSGAQDISDFEDQDIAIDKTKSTQKLN